MPVHVGFAIKYISMYFFSVNPVCCKIESASHEKQSSCTLPDTCFFVSVFWVDINAVH